ncbi:MAG: transcription-repair coupling factor [Thiotrichales bacterium]
MTRSEQPLLTTTRTQSLESTGMWTRLYGAAQPIAINELVRRHKGLVLVVTPDSHSADQLEQELRFFLSQNSHNLHLFPEWETLPYDLFSPHEDIISARLSTLHSLPSLRKGLLIVPVSTLMQRLPPQEFIEQQSFTLKAGDRIDIAAFRERLESSGYSAVSQVLSHGEFCSRGSLIDVFPMGSEQPYRIDLFDDEIESIRSFDPETQTSIEKLTQINLLPSHEFPMDEAGIKAFRQRYRERFEGDPQNSRIYTAVSAGTPPGGIEYYLPLFHQKTATLFDFLPKNTQICLLDTAMDTVDTLYTEYQDRYEQRRHDIERPILRPDEITLTPVELEHALARWPQLTLKRMKEPTANSGIEFAAAPLDDVSIKVRQERPAEALTKYLQEKAGRTLFLADSPGRRELLIDTLAPFKIKPRPVADWQGFLSSKASVCISVAPVETGVDLYADEIRIIPESALFADRVRQARRRRKPTRDADAVVRNLTDLNIGSPVVHEDHGVGRYLGLQKLDVGGVDAEYLTLEYSGGDKLYVPVSNLHLISRFTGADADSAPMHKLGGEQWQKARRKAAEKAHDVAAELLDIHARRAARKGFSYETGSLDYQAFAASFPFEETEDQHNAIEAVLADLASEQPMDRVVCGDVGFGKTEVALRAAFIVANTGRQVAVLVPTTLLAEQHSKNFADRFSDWPLRVEALSRFRTPKEQKAILAAMESGQVDIVIGTHKLLQKDIKFKNLGLVIIDEEQRFGVRHKERLKSLRAEVDLLTLTATPIPRTLNMSLAGLRDLSIIATPPMQRHAIKTFVCEWDKPLILEACQREIRRGGQIYFLHNEVKTIEKAARELEELVPEATVRIGHGQMAESELEQVMLDFYHQRFNVLVCTTIIETGIDVPSANTIIIHRADKFGLSQLHQLRGRVGRSHHRAYAYLITPNRKAMTPDAVKRLEAIEALEDLGVGFTLATHDLEIRGAGELLGGEQSGQIQEVGFNMYNELLERAVKALKSGHMPETPDELGSQISDVDLGVPALLPEDYIADVHVRLILYKRIASATSEAALKDLQIELIDRFGLLPDQAKNLFETARLKLSASRLGIKKIDVGPLGGRILFNAKPEIDVTALLRLIQLAPKDYKMDGQDKLRFSFDEDMDQPARIQRIEYLLETLRIKQ